MCRGTRPYAESGCRFSKGRSLADIRLSGMNDRTKRSYSAKGGRKCKKKNVLFV